ncbi:MAG: hypothetical protein EOO38_04120 [Cytophagaceae bacterium]|nr:MAG: hypothetical protein EOO38_04120 [Cytophagaceae bacterium]
MIAETQLLYVRKPLPIVGRIFVGGLGLAFVIAFCIVIFTPSEWPKTFWHWLLIVGVAFCGYAFIQAAFSSGEIRFDPGARELFVVTRGVVPRRSTQRFSTASIRAVRTHYSRGVIGGAHWELWLDHGTGDSQLLILLSASTPAGEVARTISASIGVTTIHNDA